MKDDTKDLSQEEFETFENLRMFIEKHGRPYNYLDSFDKLQQKHM